MELITSYICKTSDIGLHGNMFGGTIMSLIDDAAAGYAAQLCDTPNVVTIKIDEMLFKKPVKTSSLLKVYGKATEFGRTSISLYIEVRNHNVITDTQDIVTTTNIKFVKIDEAGHSAPIGEDLKERYMSRVAKYGRGLLTPEESEIERNAR